MANEGSFRFAVDVLHPVAVALVDVLVVEGRVGDARTLRLDVGQDVTRRCF